MRSCTWPLLPDFITDMLYIGVRDDDEIQPRLTRMDDAFCARMRAAIEAGLEIAPIGVVTTPGTQSPRYVPAEPLALTSWPRDRDI